MYALSAYEHTIQTTLKSSEITAEFQKTDQLLRQLTGQGFTVQGAMLAMKEMQAGDYEFLTVTELLSRNGTPPENGVTYKRG